MVELTLAGWRTNAYIARVNKEVHWDVHHLSREALYAANGWNSSRAMSKYIPRVIVSSDDAAQVEMHLRGCLAARPTRALHKRRSGV